VLIDHRVSRRHATLTLANDRWVLADAGSTNGIYAGDRRVDRIEIDG
jgi:pSer/pThr/pTyr-binding forkhead associated (FHA) protein